MGHLLRLMFIGSNYDRSWMETWNGDGPLVQTQFYWEVENVIWDIKSKHPPALACWPNELDCEFRRITFASASSPITLMTCDRCKPQLKWSAGNPCCNNYWRLKKSSPCFVLAHRLWFMPRWKELFITAVWSDGPLMEYNAGWVRWAEIGKECAPWEFILTYF